MKDLKEEVVGLIEKEIDDILAKEEIEKLVEIPPDSEMGDYAFPCFRLSKALKKSPNLISQELAEKIEKNSYIEKVESLGPYLNFFIDKEKLTEIVLNEVKEKKERYGSSDMGKGKTVIVEYSSPNIAKPFHIGHIRTTIIGHALYDIYKYLGYNAVAINHLGDYGTQFGKLIVAYKKWGDRKIVEKDPINELLKLYVKFHKEMENDSTLEEQARHWFKKLEDGDSEALELWQWMRDMSLKEFNRVYDILGIKFDSFTGESFYSDKMPKVVDDMRKKGILKKSQGAEIVDLEPYGMPPALITKSDGSTLYITRDIAAAIYRKEHYNFYKNVYVVGSEQILHFKQWKKIVELIGYPWAKDCIHVNFGMVRLEEGTMSTRKGRVVFLEDVLKKAVEKTLAIIEERNPNLENKDEVAKQVGIGAIVFQELFNNRIKDYTFTWEKTLSFDGETGPYVQYTYARANRLLEKGNFSPDNEIDYSILSAPEEINIIKMIYNFPKEIVTAMEKNEPSFVARSIMGIAKAFNSFYNSCPIMQEEDNLKNARLQLVWATKSVIKAGLSLLGMETPDKM
ncbi:MULTISPECIES: arginine--tRNA ligase [Tissierellales]|jgi:arginyl-tRNA synthetase|uniref:Arginine--tRNA ligase n=1 Tax=Acidilutibacter cellobiosedens TaxID=2507161 RepID=A0A410QBH9_9FIRM|nr:MULTISPECIES: arginine--tRNA ligase [Tissierellales]QAT61351.1 arginine--tRNA ligase [Acidilutibacter cellobiosedens]SCL94919.1 Arginine-tRNA ligase [Sporanaerobacter sp. PP17-6a]